MTLHLLRYRIGCPNQGRTFFLGQSDLFCCAFLEKPFYFVFSNFGCFESTVTSAFAMSCLVLQQDSIFFCEFTR